jgi:hypothetical protein
MRNQLVSAWCVLDLSCSWGSFWIPVSILIWILISKLFHQAPYAFSCFGLSRKSWKLALEAGTSTPRGANVVSNVLWVAAFELSLKHFGGLWASLCSNQMFSRVVETWSDKDLVFSRVWGLWDELGTLPSRSKLVFSHVFQSLPIKNLVFSRVLSNCPALGSDYGSSRVPEKPRSAKTSCFLVFLWARLG